MRFLKLATFHLRCVWVINSLCTVRKVGASLIILSQLDSRHKQHNIVLEDSTRSRLAFCIFRDAHHSRSNIKCATSPQHL